MVQVQGKKLPNKQKSRTSRKESNEASSSLKLDYSVQESLNN